MFCEKLFKDIEEGHHSGFWIKFHGCLHHSTSTLSTRIHEILSVEDILKVWKDQFSAIVNSESCDSVKDDCMVFEEMVDSHMGDLQIFWWSVGRKGLWAFESQLITRS